MAYTLVQSRSVQAATATSVSLAFNSNVTAGRTIIAAGGVFGVTFGTGGGSDSLGNTYTRDASGIASSDAQHTAVFSAPITTGGACTVTLTASGSGNPGFAIHEVYGLDNTSLVDVIKVNGADSVATTAHTSGTSPATTNANDLIFIADSHSSSTVGSASASGYTTAQMITATSPSIPIFTAHKRVTATGTQSATITWVTGSRVVVLIAYKEDPTAPPLPNSGPTLYLTNTASDINPGAELEKVADLVRDTASVDKPTTTTASGTNIQATDTAGGTALAWLSPALEAVSLSGTVTVNLRGRESANTVNSGRGILIQRTDNAGAVQATILADTAHGTEFTTTDAANAAWTPAITSTSIAQGERIKITVKVRNVGTMASGTVTYSIGGPTAAAAGDSFVTFGQTLTEYVASAAATSFPPQSAMAPYLGFIGR